MYYHCYGKIKANLKPNSTRNSNRYTNNKVTVLEWAKLSSQPKHEVTNTLFKVLWK